MEGSSVLLEQEDVKGQGCPRTGRLSAGNFLISAPLNGLAPHSFLDGLRQLASPLRGSARCLARLEVLYLWFAVLMFV